MWWHALRGWGKWAVGRRALHDEQERRLAVCSRCPRVEGVWVDESPAMRAASIAFCKPIKEALVVRCGACECLLGVQSETAGVRVSGILFEPAGKPEVADEECPLGRW